MKNKPMGKGLNAILKAPEKLRPVGRSEATAEEMAAPEVPSEGEVAAKEVIAPEVITEEVATAEVPVGDVTAKEGIAAEVTAVEAATAEELSDEATKKATPPKLAARGATMSQDAISRAVSDAKRSPRISTWSPVAVSTLKFLRMTQPQFSMSDEMRTLIEEGLARKYPKLVERVKKELEKSG
jgi:hypothetical protein